VSDVQVKWTLEHRSKNPGIGEDDMFLSNDPWVGAAHQMDVTLLTPLVLGGQALLLDHQRALSLEREGGAGVR
jgi:N-methylhydantoinase B/oxoprolinase/acetone carboxylase alpha subunit